MSEQIKDTVIPSCVVANKGIKIAPSQIPNAGRGLFALEDVKDGELIFTIPRPLITIVDPMQKSKICDNCLAMKDPSTIQNAENLQLLCCSVCKEVYYCSKECQREAWGHHHRLECKTFVALSEIQVDGIKLLDYNNGIRGLARLFLHWNWNHLTKEEMTEFSDLKTNREMLEKNEYFAASMEEETDLLRKHIPFGARRCLEWYKNSYCALVNNNLGIHLPTLKGSWKINNLEHSSFAMAGTCLEPFVALLNHFCSSNSVWAFDGPQLNVRAKRDIAAGEELTISYIYCGRDYHERNRELLRQYGFVCTCPLCRQGFMDGPNGHPVGYLREEVLNLMDRGNPQTPVGIGHLSRAITKVMDAGYGLEKYPHRPLHQMLLCGYMKLRKYHMALKTCLLLYYWIEPYQTPPTPRVDRLETLSDLIRLLDPQQANRATSVLLHELRSHLQIHLRYKYVQETHLCYGADSTVGMFEKESFETAFGPEPFVSLQDKEERDLFVFHMSQLLEIMELPTRTEMELFWND